jgi:hypothetical protein
VRNITARGYMVSRLAEYQTRTLHDQEQRDGRCAQPHMIRVRFGLPQVGDVPEEMAMQTEIRCVAIYESSMAKYRGRHTGCCFPLADGSYQRSDGGCSPTPDVMVMHSFDREVVDQGVSFPCPETGGRARERMKL